METIGGKIKWIDMVKPAGEELEWLQKNFGLHPVVIDELKNYSVHGRVESSDEYLYLIYHFPIYDVAEKISRRAEIDFIVTKNDVISVRYDDADVFADFKETFSGGSSDKNFPDSTLELTHRLLAHLINFNQRQLNHIQEKTEAVAAELFKGNEADLLKKISYIKRDISEYQLIAKPQQHLFSSLIERGQNFWGQQSKVYLEDLLGKYLKLLARLEYHREAIMDFESTNNQLLNVRNNETMKMFTILAFATFPLMLIAALFSMRVGGVPFLDDPNGFWMITGVVAVAIVVMLVFFKKKRWL
ncbi:MAG: magnesium transporter CorA family protein [Candidatus Liptonbacteria bacterium]|nr:magnesium transporter CorA family protein [Candidatus Liptonbacteria bacterium]